MMAYMKIIFCQILAIKKFAFESINICSIYYCCTHFLSWSQSFQLKNLKASSREPALSCKNIRLSSATSSKRITVKCYRQKRKNAYYIEMWTQRGRYIGSWTEENETYISIHVNRTRYKHRYIHIYRYLHIYR